MMKATVVLFRLLRRTAASHRLQTRLLCSLSSGENAFIERCKEGFHVDRERLLRVELQDHERRHGPLSTTCCAELLNTVVPAMGSHGADVVAVFVRRLLRERTEGTEVDEALLQALKSSQHDGDLALATFQEASNCGWKPKVDHFLRLLECLDLDGNAEAFQTHLTQMMETHQVPLETLEALMLRLVDSFCAMHVSTLTNLTCLPWFEHMAETGRCGPVLTVLDSATPHVFLAILKGLNKRFFAQRQLTNDAMPFSQLLPNMFAAMTRLGVPLDEDIMCAILEVAVAAKDWSCIEMCVERPEMEHLRESLPVVEALLPTAIVAPENVAEEYFQDIVGWLQHVKGSTTRDTVVSAMFVCAARGWKDRFVRSWAKLKRKSDHERVKALKFCAQHGWIKEAEEIFKSFESVGLKHAGVGMSMLQTNKASFPKRQAFCRALFTHCNAEFVVWLVLTQCTPSFPRAADTVEWAIKEAQRYGFRLSTRVCTQLVAFYSALGDFQAVDRWTDVMQKDNVELDNRLVTVLLKSCIKRTDGLKRAREWLERVERVGLALSSHNLMNFVEVLGTAGEYDVMWKQFSNTTPDQWDTNLINSVMNWCSKDLRPVGAVRLFQCLDMFKKADLEATSFTYNIVLEMLCERGNAKEVDAMLDRTLNSPEPKLNAFSFALLFRHCLPLMELERAVKYFEIGKSLNCLNARALRPFMQVVACHKHPDQFIETVAYCAKLGMDMDTVCFNAFEALNQLRCACAQAGKTARIIHERFAPPKPSPKCTDAFTRSLSGATARIGKGYIV